MANQNGKKKGKGIGIFAVIWVAVVLLSSLGDLLEEAEFGAAAPGPIIGGIIVVIAVILIIRKLKKRAAEQGTGGAEYQPDRQQKVIRPASVHSHDRLQAGTGNESEFEHRKKQLDSFLANGIIERDEYRVLLEKYRNL